MKHSMRRPSLVILLIAFAMIVAACSSSTDDTTTSSSTTAAGPEIGSAENPIQILFVPSVSAELIVAGGEILKGVLEEATGLIFEVSVPTSYAATINEMCASTDNTIGFIPATAYVLGNDLCGLEVALKSKRNGYTEYWAEFIVPRDSDATSIADLAGLKWAYPDAGSTSGFLVPSGMFKQGGIVAGESFEAGGHSATVRAVYNGEADFGTVFFSPAIDADRTVLWDGTTTNADVPDDQVEACELDATFVKRPLT
jgi:phosphonate transport system substrate-binding protein